MNKKWRLLILALFVFLYNCASESKMRVRYTPLEDQVSYRHKKDRGNTYVSPSPENRRYIIIKRKTDRYQDNSPKTGSMPENNEGSVFKSSPLTERQCCYKLEQGSEEIQKKNSGKPKSIETKKLADFVQPLAHSAISSPFGIRRQHPVDGRRNRLHLGVDLRADYGSPIFSVHEGIVSGVFRKQWLGLGVEINHGYGFRSVYGHLSKIVVREGDKVMAGEKIGYSGDSGVVTGPHLHLEIWKDGKPVDPQLFIKFVP